MFNHVFVAHLKKKKHLTPEQALETMEAQKDVRIRIGTLAVEERLLTPEQAEFLNHQQARHNTRFGELAIQAGYLTQEQLDALLEKQPRDFVVLKQILTDKQYMTSEQIDAALSDFRDDLGVEHHEFEELLDNNIDVFISKIADIARKDDPVMNVFSQLFISTIARLIDKEVMVDKAVKTSIDTVPYTASVKLFGDLTWFLAFSAGKSSAAMDFAKRFALGFMGAEIDATDEIAQDAMKEFLNCVGGLLITELTSEGRLNLDLGVPGFHEEFPVGREIVMLPFHLLNGEKLNFFVMRVLKS